ncbi:MAG: hypothetical protein LBO67_04540 [Spirochaetaceae bacterium]|nr:hypothetical protein [Spirochaetaceae bacterium]
MRRAGRLRGNRCPRLSSHHLSPIPNCAAGDGSRAAVPAANGCVHGTPSAQDAFMRAGASMPLFFRADRA